MSIEQDSRVEALERSVRRAYSQRANLAVAFAKMAAAQGWPYGRGIDSKTENDMEWRHVLYVELPGGEQISYHFAPDDVHLLDGLPTYRGEWDGRFTGTTEWHELLPGPPDNLRPELDAEQFAELALSGMALRRWHIERRKLEADPDVSGADRERILLGYAKAWSR